LRHCPDIDIKRRPLEVMGGFGETVVAIWHQTLGTITSPAGPVAGHLW
jgi:hypothetical protein